MHVGLMQAGIPRDLGGITSLAADRAVEVMGQGGVEFLCGWFFHGQFRVAEVHVWKYNRTVPRVQALELDIRSAAWYII